MLGFVLLLPALAVYLLWVRSVRYDRIRSTLYAYAQRHHLTAVPPLVRKIDKKGKSIAPTRAEYPMTPAEAQIIVQMDVELEFPFGSDRAIDLATLKTFGIESIAKVFKMTGQLNKPKTGGRRLVDSLVLINSWITYPLLGPGSGAVDDGRPLDPRGALAIARMNYFRFKYKAHITNDDLLYTLATFLLEPREWIDRYEWRGLTPLEEQASFVFWSGIGRRMGITGIPSELQEMIDWTEAYEISNGLHSEICRDFAGPTLDNTLSAVPELIRPTVRSAILSLLDPRVRAACMFPEPSRFIAKSLDFILLARTQVVKHLHLPRSRIHKQLPTPLESPAFPSGYVAEAKQLDEKSNGLVSVDADGLTIENGAGSTMLNNGDVATTISPRSFVKRYDFEPWYFPTPPPPSFPYSLFQSSASPRTPSPNFRSEGYRLEEIGPAHYEKMGHEMVMKEAERIQGSRVEGPYAVGGVEKARCPMGFGSI